MNLRGVLRRKGVYICRKAGKKIADCFSEFLQTSTNGTFQASKKFLLDFNTYVRKNYVTKDEHKYITATRMDFKNTNKSRYSISVASSSTINDPKIPFSMDDLPRVLGNISKMYQAEDKKYGGWNDSLDYKMDMYKDICDIYQCPIDRRMDSSLERASLR
ncbi:hypothetical protein OnM2_009012 [Erysiphe neolycopersici]|uniref:Uncharacterized protein n=1 Tax=Erysiphe neolycopersici TaxID=212602 RepID=A0A420I6R2_9PEZI|nr:hypothetical protein OnM2_009012 [Erysiphe neolycopersici]